MTLIARLVALMAVVALAAGAPASAAEPRASFNDIEDEVMCDVCNVPLNIAEAPRADQQRREIRGLIAEGMTKDQVKDELRRRYGPAILAVPEDRGFGLAAWLVPIAVVVSLLAGLALLLPRWRRRPPPPRPGDGGGAELEASDARRLDEDLARYGA
jgi:cytochrome c-type biogenesis protein CcmH/NrfF